MKLRKPGSAKAERETIEKSYRHVSGQHSEEGPEQSGPQDLDPFAGYAPLTVEQQWKEVEEAYVYLQDNRNADLPYVDSYNQAWDMLDTLNKVGGVSVMRRGAAGREADTPLTALFFLVEMGVYPPPELLMGLSEAWKRYMAAAGRMSLEEAFFGPSRKGAGNYAKRKKAVGKDIRIRMSFLRLLKQGLSRTKAAEQVSNSIGGKPDADSLLRMLRGFRGFKKPGAEK